jgi:hypothetical protein
MLSSSGSIKSDLFENKDMVINYFVIYLEDF